jgi:hypothetical protein
MLKQFWGVLNDKVSVAVDVLIKVRGSLNIKLVCVASVLAVTYHLLNLRFQLLPLC